VSTYGEISSFLNDEGSARAARAVGTALKGNPFAPMVPCHRVVKSDLHIGGFSGSTDVNSVNVKRKIKILTDEGVKITTDKGTPRISSSDFVYKFPKTPLTTRELAISFLQTPME